MKGNGFFFLLLVKGVDVTGIGTKLCNMHNCMSVAERRETQFVRGFGSLTLKHFAPRAQFRGSLCLMCCSPLSSKRAI